MPSNVTILNATLASQGPTGPQGPKGDVGFLYFEIKNGDLYVTNETPTEITFSIVDGELYMEVGE